MYANYNDVLRKERITLRRICSSLRFRFFYFSIEFIEAMDFQMALCVLWNIIFHSMYAVFRLNDERERICRNRTFAWWMSKKCSPGAVLHNASLRNSKGRLMGRMFLFFRSSSLHLNRKLFNILCNRLRFSPSEDGILSWIRAQSMRFHSKIVYLFRYRSGCM